MATRLLMVTALVACGAKPPAPPQPPTDRSAVAMRELAATMTPISRESAKIEPPELDPNERKVRTLPPIAGRPAFDPDPLIPDTTPILRWPLMASSHPELTPQFAIAAALAEPGLDWIGLCRLGAHHRHAGRELRDQVAYLGAWCAVADHDIDGALAGFASLGRSVVSGLVPAVREDIVNVLLDHGGADEALRLLSKHQLGSLEVLDRLAATYLDVGSPDDATALNEITIVRDDPNRGNRCRRQARRVAMNPNPYRLGIYSGVLLFDEPKGSDRTCTRLEAELACWLRPALNCADYFKDRGLDPRTAHLMSAFYSWPTSYAASTHQWLSVADYAIAAGTLPLAYDFAVEALEQAVRSGGCRAPWGHTISKRVRSLLDAADRPKAFDERLRVLETEPETLCD